MCGIAGFWDFRKRLTEADLLLITNTLVHRGPDGSGSFFDIREGLGLGHRRLAIIDLSSGGRQPMGDGSGSNRVTINAEASNVE